MSVSSASMAQVIQRYFPAAASHSPDTSSTEIDIQQVSQAVFPDIAYADNEKVEMSRWLATSSRIDSADEGKAKQAERLVSLNTYLSTRTTLLGSKPSIADVALYAYLMPLVKPWSAEERTGELGYHHIVRYIDFVQNAPLLGLSIDLDDKVAINANEVQFVHKPIDTKEEKERKKIEKALAAGKDEQQSLVVGREKPGEDKKSRKEKAKEAISIAKQTVTTTLTNDPAPSQTKKEKRAKTPNALAKEASLSPSLIDLRVGHILKAVNHPNADSLYVSTIACGDPPGTDNTSEYDGQIVRTVCSGLNGLVPLAEMQNRKIVAVCNLKPVTMRGIKSAAMVLAASPRLVDGKEDKHAGPVELVSPPEGASAGERVWFEGWEGEPESMLNPKKKVWEILQPGFCTTEGLEVAFDCEVVEALKEVVGGKGFGKLVAKNGGECMVKSLKGATVR